MAGFGRRLGGETLRLGLALMATGWATWAGVVEDAPGPALALALVGYFLLNIVFARREPAAPSSSARRNAPARSENPAPRDSESGLVALEARLMRARRQAKRESEAYATLDGLVTLCRAARKGAAEGDRGATLQAGRIRRLGTPLADLAERIAVPPDATPEVLARSAAAHESLKEALAALRSDRAGAGDLAEQAAFEVEIDLLRQRLPRIESPLAETPAATPSLPDIAAESAPAR